MKCLQLIYATALTLMQNRRQSRIYSGATVSCGHALSHIQGPRRCSWSWSGAERSFQPGSDLKPWNLPWQEAGWDWYLTQRLTRSKCVWYYRWTGAPLHCWGLPKVVMVKYGVCVCVCVEILIFSNGDWWQVQTQPSITEVCEIVMEFNL